ncbi:hypothetical protein [Agrobacterium tumefaciens]|jgi:hypothetical protein|uniref:Uncharacterized protein n=1 Tax=Agrobacterium tumefaciens str. B6 TaxID=1183423 RepID=A0A822V1E8_AGRTU|nr:hypothetical protein [Agrobacterium tumefaciens]AYM08868.1 hypothetical protein At1D1460_46270 [Agrobacterium tumefaciens]NSZ35563.1 hypothetical protein [Agrobacterium tumefaciens]NTA92832.1 hypothetical protein [Agrobacterium tumefaciens]QLG25257.1 hypothetical protein EML4_23315 [Agrobacterium tumefaciens]UXS87455.1 hypothetical protein FY144_14210 [Agrobacterium tumefaciens]
MRNCLQSPLDAECVHLVSDATKSYVRRIGFPPYAGKGITKNPSVFS